MCGVESKDQVVYITNLPSLLGKAAWAMWDMCIRKLEVVALQICKRDDIMVSTEYSCDPFQKWQLK